ncbi:unnamed protein product [Diatraea saccharalis]|uniref:Uncharacterized protein n=1 Tax=Diatraea saccharalis TaxID=40085 RepID=A0A9N9R508_9NEOP|nr:unnamed protein product [Diatraea saccharalis]
MNTTKVGSTSSMNTCGTEGSRSLKLDFGNENKEVQLAPNSYGSNTSIVSHASFVSAKSSDNMQAKRGHSDSESSDDSGDSSKTVTRHDTKRVAVESDHSSAGEEEFHSPIPSPVASRAPSPLPGNSRVSSPAAEVEHPIDEIWGEDDVIERSAPPKAKTARLAKTHFFGAAAAKRRLNRGSLSLSDVECRYLESDDVGIVTDIPEGMSVSEMHKKALGHIDELALLHKKSKNLKGPVIKQLKIATASLKQVWLRTARMSSKEEILLLRADNARLSGELDVLRREVAALKRERSDRDALLNEHRLSRGRHNKSLPMEVVAESEHDVNTGPLKELIDVNFKSLSSYFEERFRDQESRLMPINPERPPLASDTPIRTAARQIARPSNEGKTGDQPFFFF